ncbi:hypothetical protein FOZ62_000327 [Perkinsus olseni]|uniref:Amino acid transporter transmembrane domain-containing protein n=1 Tax=Perkinsus olseni TaxID=32597 RepID=A0A7J6RPW4_PEROL|nr:hypothetical protein FOZ62_000327 [Perkinsus olseni]
MARPLMKNCRRNSRSEDEKSLRGEKDTTTTLLLCVICALCAIAVPSLVDLLGVLGGFCAVMLIFVFPACVLCLHEGLTLRSGVITVAFLVFTVIGLYSAVASLVQFFKRP